MGKKTTYVNYWVKVQVDKGIPHKDPEIDHKQNLQACDRMKSEIRRHCDVDHMETYVETEEVCKYCGSLWTEGDKPNNGGCCADDANHMYMEQVETAIHALKLITAQEEGCEGKLKPEDWWLGAKSIATKALQDITE